MNSYIEDIYIKRLGKGDMFMARQLIQLLQDVFEREYEAAQDVYLIKWLENAAFIAYVAIHKDEVVGGLTAYELPMYHSAYTEIFIYDIAVKPLYQRKGIGNKLLATLKEYGREQGISEIFVPASEEDTHAVEFYHATGGQAEKVIHFTYSIHKRSKHE